LGGREFESFANGTAEHDLFVMAKIRQAGLYDLEVRAGETAEMFADRLLGDLIVAGVVFDLISAWIVPKGMTALDWSPAMARATGDHLRTLIVEEDKAAIRSLILQLLIDFFARGTISLFASGKSFAEDRPAAMRNTEF